MLIHDKKIHGYQLGFDTFAGVQLPISGNAEHNMLIPYSFWKCPG
jgi:hypothetical protein